MVSAVDMAGHDDPSFHTPLVRRRSRQGANRFGSGAAYITQATLGATNTPPLPCEASPVPLRPFPVASVVV